MSDESNDAKRAAAWRTFKLLYAVTQASGILCFLMMLIWVTCYLGGLGWEVPVVRFNWHPLCMVLGMLYLAGNSILSFRLLRSQPKPMVKLIHGGLHVSAFVISAFGSFAAFSFHFDAKIPNLYTLHSWIGALTMTLFFLQYFGAFYNFLYPTTSSAFRTWLLPYHVLGGFIIFGLALASCITGLTEKAIFMGLSPNAKYKWQNFGAVTFVINFCGLLMLVFGVLVLYMATERNFRRIYVPEQQPLTNKSRDSSMQLDSPAAGN